MKVSVLFSEPKIPQSRSGKFLMYHGSGFSALQRAENSSILIGANVLCTIRSFSALQRAENSSIPFLNVSKSRESRVSVLFSEPKIPQSRSDFFTYYWDTVSVLFSEPKIPQCDSARDYSSRSVVSVLFSEPKIPQCPSAAARWATIMRFSALQRAENSSIEKRLKRVNDPVGVSVLFSEPKIPQCQRQPQTLPAATGFSALQRAENSSIRHVNDLITQIARFQCSSASRKFLNCNGRVRCGSVQEVSVLFSEPKIPQYWMLYITHG